MAAFSAAPRIGDLEAVFHMYSYLKWHQRSRLVFDSAYNKEIKIREKPDWSPFYGDLQEEDPPGMPKPRGKPVQQFTYEDSDHAGDTVTRRSRTGVLMFVNRAPIAWYSKKQLSVETSTFSSEFMALKTAIELSIGLRYKLKMMGVPLDGPIVILADNQSVVVNASHPPSVLKKKSVSIAYHFCREHAARGTVQVCFVRSEENLADMLTKTQPGPKRQSLVKHVLQ